MVRVFNTTHHSEEEEDEDEEGDKIWDLSFTEYVFKIPGLLEAFDLAWIKDDIDIRLTPFTVNYWHWRDPGPDDHPQFRIYSSSLTDSVKARLEANKYYDARASACDEFDFIIKPGSGKLIKRALK